MKKGKKEHDSIIYQIGKAPVEAIGSFGKAETSPVEESSRESSRPPILDGFYFLLGLFIISTPLILLGAFIAGAKWVIWTGVGYYFGIIIISSVALLIITSILSPSNESDSTQEESDQ